MVSMHDLAAGDRITVLPKASDRLSEPWGAVVRDVVLPSRDSNGGVWTTQWEWVPAHRVGDVKPRDLGRVSG